MGKEQLPLWISSLDPEELEFIRKFMINSGSLKKLAKDYEVSYPTVRLKLDRLIQTINLNYEKEKDEASLTSFIKKLAIEEQISLQVAQQLIEKYEEERKRTT
ncbi:DUF2089 family protein [Bhargavaea beijingensis]|uniref:DUF2089 family protein n=1 Tax=Bhargavaea beijingensis TaxID=426756 RepID=A0ABX9ZCH7_9BACL|nr:DUF2089 family protein [Bhargavaea beijingensis]MCW1927878.1 DUF2089 domain-containing protein [Bhargavaea beijingensis]RSK31873.1 DUF2089 family protein [Bhargavaea beijingensis]